MNSTSTTPKAFRHTVKDYWILGIAILAYAIPISIYWWYFENFTITSKNEYWGQFGDFIGGVVNPFVAILALWAILWPIKQNQKALKISEDELIASRKELELTRIELAKTSAAAQQQADHLLGEAKKNDLKKLIDLSDKEIEGILKCSRISSLEIPMGPDPSRTHESIHWFLIGGQETDQVEQNRLIGPHSVDNTVKNLCVILSKNLALLSGYLNEYENIAMNGIISQFYQKKFGQLVEILKKYGFEIEGPIQNP